MVGLHPEHNLSACSDGPDVLVLRVAEGKDTVSVVRSNWQWAEGSL